MDTAEAKTQADTAAEEEAQADAAAQVIEAPFSSTWMDLIDDSGPPLSSSAMTLQAPMREAWSAEAAAPPACAECKTSWAQLLVLARVGRRVELARGRRRVCAAQPAHTGGRGADGGSTPPLHAFTSFMDHAG